MNGLTEIKLEGGPADGVTTDVPALAEELMLTSSTVTAEVMASALALLETFPEVPLPEPIQTHIYRRTDRMEIDSCPVHGAHGGWVFQFVETKPLSLDSIHDGMIGPF